MGRKMKLKINDEFKKICTEIVKENWDVNQWADHEAGDWFQTKNYAGGFDATEMEFCFSYFDENGDEYWFQFPLEDVNKILNGEISEIEMRPPR